MWVNSIRAVSGGHMWVNSIRAVSGGHNYVVNSIRAVSAAPTKLSWRLNEHVCYGAKCKTPLNDATEWTPRDIIERCDELDTALYN